MGVVKKSKPKNEKNSAKVKNNDGDKKNVANGKSKEKKVKKKRTVSCLQCIKSHDDGGAEGKYRVAAPELMQDTFMSDSEDEGGEVECPIQQQQQYRYMNSEAGTLHRARPLEDSVTDGHLWPSNNDGKVATIDRQPLDIGFLVSFVVDARGGAMKAKRRGGVRIIVPPAACAAPTRVTCRAATRRAPAAAPPPLMEGEALASRLLELQPQGVKFLAPVIIEVPIYTSSCREREIVILRSDTGDTWQDHYLHNNDNPLIQEALQRERAEHGPCGESLGEGGERVCRVVTCDFPHYLACVSRVRQEVHIIGPEGGTVSSAHTPQVQALFPPQALTKRIRVGLQAHGAAPELARRVLPRHVAVSPVITVEPRRRKFHRSITLTAPLPSLDGKPDKSSTHSLRLLCSIMGGQARAVWEDVTGSTPLTVTEDCASFTTTVSARFWLMNCQNVSEASKLATELYREMLLVPFSARVLVLGKRLDALEGRLLVLYITDRYAYDTLRDQEHYTEVAHSTAVKFLDGKDVYLEFSGNLVPVTKSGSQPSFTFESFKDNRVEFTVRVKHHEESPAGRIYFMTEPKVAKGEQSPTPACVLDVALPERVAPRAGKSQTDCLNLDQSGFDALKDELSFHWGDHHHSIGPPSLPPPVPDSQQNGHDTIITNGNVKYEKDGEEKDSAKPHLNGDTVHVDSNKTKATFDSDEDKTPHNTLEKSDKGKKNKEGGGFFGGIAGKVKNVFSHSEDREDDSKESSPKPQPKPRDSKEKEIKEKEKDKKEKEKSPPKPAPRLINEDLLDKVEDMFKDLHSKPPKDDEIDSKIYATKLVVEEDAPGSRNKEEELLAQYANMLPVETPIRDKKQDPFATFYGDCCENRFKGQKHTHDETCNLVDRIENEKFTAGEKLADISDRVKSDINEGLDKLEKDKDNLSKQVGEVKEDIVKKSQEVKSDIVNKEKELENAAKDKLDDLKQAVCAAQDEAEHKAHTIDFLARERAEAVKLQTEDKLAKAGEAVEGAADSLKNKAQEVGSDIKHKAQDLKDGAKQTAENVKDATNEKIHELNESLDHTKEKAKDAAEAVGKKAKKKGKEGKNFLSGLVHNVFGSKDKVESEIKGKIAESKDAANDLLDQAAAKKDELKDNVAKKQGELKDGVDSLAQSARDKKEKFEKDLSEEKAAIEKSIEERKDEAVKAVHETTDSAKQAIKDKKDQVEDAIHETADSAKQAVKDKKDQVVDAIHETADSAKQAVKDKKDQVVDAIHETADSAKQAAKDKKDQVVDAIHETTDSAKQALKDKKDQIEDAVHSKKEQIETAVQNKADEAKKAVDGAKDELVQFGEAVHDKANEAKQAVHDKKDEIEQGIHNKAVELENAAHEKAEEAKKAVSDKKDQLVDGAKSIVDQAAAKKDEIGAAIVQKHDELKDGAESLVQNAQAKKDEVSKAIHDKADDAAKAVEDKKAEFAKKTSEIAESISNKKDEVSQAVHDKVSDAKDVTASELDRIRQEAEYTTDQIKKSAEDTLNAAADKKAEVQANITNKVDELQKSGKEGIENLQSAASDKASELQRSSKQAFDHAQDQALGTFDRLESSAKDRVSDAAEAWDDVQSSTRDTFADFKDDVHSWENSAQDTLHSFQSSAGNTFDSLDDSAREFVGGVQTAGSNVEAGAKELFGDVKDSFEGFQVSADNKLEDVKGAAHERLAAEADDFTSSLNDLGNSVFGSSGKGFMKDSSAKLLESEKSQASPSPQKKSSGIPKLKKKNKK